VSLQFKIFVSRGKFRLRTDIGSNGVQGLGYLISTVSVIFLGIVAWPDESDPEWHAWIVIVGVITAILGMFLRYLAHRKNRRDIKRAERKAEQS
jgi:protein-S-isoprenylcysteine O-methyltransferase Ste14